MTHPRTAHLIYGPTASGKSTYARKLATEEHAVRFAIDDWMYALFGSDVPETMDMSWAMTRVARCQSVMWSTSRQILASGADVVLELGLLRRRDRDRMKSLVEEAGHLASFCFIDADRDLRRQRAFQRNKDKGDTYSFEVTPGMFDAMETIFERPDDDEQKRSTLIFTGSANE